MKQTWTPWRYQFNKSVRLVTKWLSAERSTVNIRNFDKWFSLSLFNRCFCVPDLFICPLSCFDLSCTCLPSHRHCLTLWFIYNSALQPQEQIQIKKWTIKIRNGASWVGTCIFYNAFVTFAVNQPKPEILSYKYMKQKSKVMVACVCSMSVYARMQN